MRIYSEKPDNYYEKKKVHFSMQLKLDKKMVIGSHNFVRERRNILFKLSQCSLAGS